jgi:hypothetical protein
MNALCCKNIGMPHTKIEDAHGLGNNISNPKDLQKLLMYIKNNHDLMSILALPSVIHKKRFNTTN